MTNGRDRTQASATVATLELCFDAISRIFRNRSPGAILVDRREVETGAATLAIAGSAGPIFAGQQAAGERRPDHQPQFLFDQQRNDVTLKVAAGDRVIGLHRLEAGESRGRSEMPSALAMRQACQLETPA